MQKVCKAKETRRWRCQHTRVCELLGRHVVCCVCYGNDIAAAWPERDSTTRSVKKYAVLKLELARLLMHANFVFIKRSLNIFIALIVILFYLYFKCSV